MELTSQKQCPKCNNEVSETAYFCSNCGYALKSKPINTSIPKQVLIYFVSFFLAPFGLGYAFKYLKQAHQKAKKIGIISLILTCLGIVAVIFIAKTYIAQEYSQLNLLQ